MEQHIKKEMDLEDIPSFTFPINSRSSSSSLDDIGYTEHPMEYYRAVSCQTGLLTNPHGSVKLFQGDTCVVAAVFGPTEVRISKELPHRGAVDVLYRPKVTGMSQLETPVMDPVLEERNTETILSSIFETSVHLEDIAGLGYNIILHEFEDDGSLLSTCINAITIALLDGGCSLRHTIAGVTLILTTDTKLIIDPSSTQLEQPYDVKFTYAFSNEMEILYTHVQGRASTEILKIAQFTASQAASEMFGFFHFVTLKKNRKLMERAKKVMQFPSAVKEEEIESPRVVQKVEELRSGESDNED